MTMVSGADGVDLHAFGAQPKITLGGSPLSDDRMTNLLRLEVETVIGRPDLCEIEFIQPMDSQGTPSGLPEAWKPGVELKVEIGTDLLFEGEVTSVDFTGAHDDSTKVILLAYDKRHRLYRTEQTKVFLDSKFDDVINALVAEVGVQATLSGLPTTVMTHYLFQGAPGDLVDWLCREYGLVAVNESKKLKLCPPKSLTADAGTISANAEIYEYRFRQTTSSDTDKTTVRTWDPKAKAAIVGEATRAATLPDGPTVTPASARQAFNLESKAIASRYASSANEAKEVAEGLSGRNVDAGMQFDATCALLPKATAGRLITVADVPDRFKGKYRLTSVRHVYDLAEGGRTTLSCRGADDPTVTGLIEQSAGQGAMTSAATRDVGVRPAVVTDIKSDDGKAMGEAGEVKVKMPWLGDDVVSGWLRVVLPGAGAKRGLFVMPEIDDEVLVAFEQGDTRRGYVLGGLYNGKDHPEPPHSQAIKGGKVEQRAFTTRINSRLLFDDTSGKEAVELAAGTEKFVMRFEEGKGLTVTNTTSGNVITMTADGDITVESKMGGLNLTAKNDVVITSQSGKISLNASAGDITGSAMNVKLNANVGAELVGSASAKVQSSGQTEVKGSLVMIN